MVNIISIIIVAFVLVLINIINNLKYRMQIRTREICMFRSIGMSLKMIKGMMVFENSILGLVGIIIAYGISNPVLKYLYKNTEMKPLGHIYQFDVTGFLIISAATLVICIVLSLNLSKGWKSLKIVEQMGNVE